MAMNKTVKWVLIVVLIFIALVLTILAVQYFTKPATAANNNTGNPSGNNIGQQTQNIISGLFNSIKNLLGKGNMAAPLCQASNPGFDNNGFYTRACGGVPGGGNANCNPDDPGKDMDGFSSSQCGG